MNETPEPYFLTSVKRAGRNVGRGLIFPQEFINKVFDEVAGIKQVDLDSMPELWSAVPENIRADFTVAVRNALQPDFRYGPFLHGGRRPMTEEELRLDADLRTARVQAWAAEFDKFLADMGV